MVTVEELKKAYEKMRSIAIEAIDLADRCHGGHSYASIRSTERKKCCEVRMQVDDLKLEVTKLSQSVDLRKMPRRRSR